MIVLESNQNHATVRDTEICPTLSASMGCGGGYVPMIVLIRETVDEDTHDNDELLPGSDR